MFFLLLFLFFPKLIPKEEMVSRQQQMFQGLINFCALRRHVFFQQSRKKGGTQRSFISLLVLEGFGRPLSWRAARPGSKHNSTSNYQRHLTSLGRGAFAQSLGGLQWTRPIRPHQWVHAVRSPRLLAEHGVSLR